MSGPASLSPASDATYLELTFKRVLCIWWSYFWRHMVYGVVAATIVATLEDLAGLRGPLVRTLSAVLVMATVSMIVLGIVLNKQFGQFSIRLVPSPEPGNSPSVLRD